MAAPVKLQRVLPPEESARGDFYALIARLLHSGPDGALLHAIADSHRIASDGEAAFARAWDDLVAASSAMDGDAAAEEYDTLFVGIGKAEVSIYAGYYSGAAAIDHPRVRLQAEMARLGLERLQTASEPEDHFAGLFDVMRVLVSGGAGREPAAVADQKRFFEEHVRAAAPKFFVALAASPHANYYRKVAAFGAAFIALETESFQLH